MDLLIQVVSLMSTAAVVTWSLAKRLSAIETAIQGHISEDKSFQKDITARVFKLEDAKRKRGSK